MGAWLPTLSDIQRIVIVGAGIGGLCAARAVALAGHDEILAEKIVAWWLFGHAKRYYDIAFLGLWLRARDDARSCRTRSSPRPPRPGCARR